MRPFRYKRADDAGSAVALLAAAPEGMFLGGGTNLVDLMRLGVETPATLIDVSRLADDLIEPSADGGLRIGAGSAQQRPRRASAGPRALLGARLGAPARRLRTAP